MTARRWKAPARAPFSRRLDRAIAARGEIAALVDRALDQENRLRALEGRPPLRGEEFLAILADVPTGP